MSKKLPFVQSEIPRDLRSFLDRLRELVSGNGSDRLLSLNDIVTSGLGNIDGNGNLTLPPGVTAVTPPAPTNLQAAAAIQNVLLTWEGLKYTGHAFTEIWGSSTNTIGTAVLLGQAPGATYVDALGPGSTRYYWVRFKNILNETGPYNAVVGVQGTTGPEVDYLLTKLTGQIKETQLYTDLGARINLIDGSGAGSVNARLLAEATARGAAITSEANARQSADTSLASQITTVTAAVNANAAAIQTEADTRASADSAEAALRTTLAARVTNTETGLTAAQSAITTESTTRASADSALASQITTLTSTVSGHTTSIQTTASTVDGLSAQYSVKIDNNGYVSGFGLSSTPVNGTPYSNFIFRADKFSIASPSGPGINPIIPFVVVTTPTTANGVTVPVGVYMDATYIKDGTITNAKIGNAAIDDAKISSLTAGKITAGSISTGEYIQSTNFISGTQGWKIYGNGTAEFGAAAIRGKLAASQIDARGLSILDSSGNVILSAGSSVATSTFGGNVSGNIDGTAASTVRTNASTALTTANTANTTANTANTTANSAKTAADDAKAAADAAKADAAAAVTAAADKLSKTGSQILTGPVALNATTAITVGTPALDSVNGHNGFYIGSTGIVGTQNGLATFTLDNNGNALFKGTVNVGASATLVGTDMTGSGALFNNIGTFALGNSSTNITFNGSTLAINGALIATNNILANAVTNYVSVTSSSTRYLLIPDSDKSNYLAASVAASTASLTTSGTGFVAINWGAVCFNGNGVYPAVPEFGSIPVTYALYRDGSVIANSSGGSQNFYIDTPSSGSHTYQVIASIAAPVAFSNGYPGIGFNLPYWDAPSDGTQSLFYYQSIGGFSAMIANAPKVTASFLAAVEYKK